MPGATATANTTRPPGGRLDNLTLAAFATVAILAGGNAVAIKLGYSELAPFWSASLRFLSAAAILLIAMIVGRLGFPSGRALAGVAIYGILNFGLTYLGGYWALREITAGTSMIVLAIVPLLTFLLAVVQRVERFRMGGLIGAALAAAGIGFIFRSGVAAASPSAWIAVFGSALCMAQAPIIVKRFPPVHPVVENAIGMAIGGLMLLAVSLSFGEARAIPNQPTTLLSLLYLIVGGSIGVFVFYLFVVNRWTASGASYVLLISPLVTLVLGAIFLGETVTWAFALGGAAVLIGVYIGAFHEKGRVPSEAPAR